MDSICFLAHYYDIQLILCHIILLLFDKSLFDGDRQFVHCHLLLSQCVTSSQVFTFKVPVTAMVEIILRSFCEINNVLNEYPCLYVIITAKVQLFVCSWLMGRLELCSSSPNPVQVQDQGDSVVTALCTILSLLLTNYSCTPDS